jgi:hypothetical protein
MASVSKTEFARILGKHKSYVTRLGDAGRLVMTADGKVDVEASQRRIAETADPGKDHVARRHADERASGSQRTQANTGGADAIGNSYQTARAVNEKYKALSAKAEYERTIGKLIDRDDVHAALDDVVSFARQSVENLPHRVAAQLVGKDFDQIMATLRQEVVSMMGDTHKEAGKRLAELTKGES